jgi:hypothetical protein
MVVAKNVTWNALDMVRVGHKPHVLSIAKIGSSRVCLQKRFEHELECLN